ncbi:MAG: bifunctional isocitrate dehydrogenase kinase/phosphatase, partial [Desulfobacterales bacterium]
PVVFALAQSSGGVMVDGVLTTENDVSILFSFTRAYFHAAVERPCELVRFLKSILPKKRIAELYTALGFQKHGKTELYRELLARLAACGEERFDTSPGVPGMVMAVFNMPGDDLVFKLIRDRFGTGKHTNRREVMDKYALVFKHDRAGRLVDAHDFEHLKLETCCFSEQLLRELTQTAASSVHVEGGQVVISHTFIQRRVVPLNVFLKQSDDVEALRAVVDFGNAIKDLAAANIFPGDILLKNFGVTRHGRVVFYDYDEICLLTQCRFRALPQARSDEDELSAEPWFLVDENDVFPEELRRFLSLPDHLLNEFLRHHSDLFGVEFWQDAQQAIKSGNAADIIPYASTRRLKR